MSSALEVCRHSTTSPMEKWGTSRFLGGYAADMPHRPPHIPVRIDAPGKDLHPELAVSMFRWPRALPRARGPWHVYISTVLSLGERQRVDESAQDNWKAATEQSLTSWVHAGTYVQRAMDDLAETGPAKP